MKALDGGRINIGACSLGGARACLEAAKTHFGVRKQFGKKLSEFQAFSSGYRGHGDRTRGRPADGAARGVSLDTRNPDATLYCAMAKRFATDACFKICNEALQLHGVLHQGIYERYLRDLRVHQILEGTNEIMRVVIARRLLAS